MKRCLYAFVALIIVSVLLGCSSRSNKKEILAAGWSDDTEYIAVLERSYVKETGFLSLTAKNVNYSITVTERDLTSTYNTISNIKGSKNALTPLISEVFYKSLSSYILIKTDETDTWAIGADSTPEPKTDYIAIDLSGDILFEFKKTDSFCVERGLPYPLLRAAPSPDGNIIAFAEVNDDCKIHLTLFDVNSRFAEVAKVSIPGIGFSGLFWVDNSSLIVNACTSKACFDNEFVGINIADSEIFQRAVVAETFDSLCLDGVIVNPSLNRNGEYIFLNENNALQIEKIHQYEFEHLRNVFRRNARNMDNPTDCVSLSNFIVENNTQDEL